MIKTSRTAKEITESIQPSFVKPDELFKSGKWRPCYGVENPTIEKVLIDEPNKLTTNNLQEKLIDENKSAVDSEHKSVSSTLTRQDDETAYVGTEHEITTEYDYILLQEEKRKRDIESRKDRLLEAWLQFAGKTNE